MRQLLSVEKWFKGHVQPHSPHSGPASRAGPLIYSFTKCAWHGRHGCEGLLCVVPRTLHTALWQACPLHCTVRKHTQQGDFAGGGPWSQRVGELELEPGLPTPNSGLQALCLTAFDVSVTGSWALREDLGRSHPVGTCECANVVRSAM